jgi:DNA-binding CsgD family transcriptional regulator
MSRKPRRFSVDEMLDIAERVRAGQGAADITAAHRTSTKSLYQLLHAAGILRPPVVSVAQAETMRTMRQQRATLAEIAAALECSADAVNNQLRRMGVRLPKAMPGEARAYMPLAPQQAPARRGTVQRRCLCCSKTFGSQHVGNRRCFDCLRNAQTLDSPYAV